MCFAITSAFTLLCPITFPYNVSLVEFLLRQLCAFPRGGAARGITPQVNYLMESIN